MRSVDWVIRLRGAVEAGACTPFAWGQHDCCIFAARCVDAVRGSRWAAELTGLYSNEFGALRFLRREGGLEAAVTRRLGEPRPGFHAGRGDICLLPTRHGPGLGVCLGPTIAVMGPDGLEYCGRGEALLSWAV